MAKGKANAWLARDAYAAGGNYVISSGNMRRGVLGLWGTDKPKLVLDEDAVSAITDLRLKPGDGPIPVNISIERAE